MLPACGIEDFRRDGYLRVRELYRAHEIEQLEAALTSATKRVTRRPGDADDSLTRDAFLSRHSGEVAAWSMDPRIGALAAELLGARGIRLIHDVLLEKDYGHGLTPWHRDSDFWSFTGGAALTIWIPLQETPLSMSPLRYAMGSHLQRNPRPLRQVEAVFIPMRFRVASSPLALGDAVVHHYRTLHGAARNAERRPRRAFALHLIDADARFCWSPDPRHIEHASRCGWDRLQDGDRLRDEIAPLIYQTAVPPWEGESTRQVAAVPG